jgi:DNA-binding response OmpR family regulator
MNTHRILVVDDEPKVAFFFQQHLQLVDESYMATAVNSGADALVELKNNPMTYSLPTCVCPK